jgi:GT2 family glycosyltransferase
LAEPAITVAIPSIRGGPLLLACLESLRRQTYSGFETVVIDNSGTGFMESELAGKFSEIRLRVFRNERNVGFGAAVNRAVEMRSAKDVGMCASQVRLFGTERLDSAGMLIALDGSSKQRGQGQPAEKYLRAEDVLLPSASAALYRREMLEDIGLFDEDFFLYCEDTDLGLRGRRNGWRCRYAPQAVVDHHYSQSSGAVSALKAWYVERNRLWVLAKNFPRRALWAVPVHAILRYFWHTWYLLRGEGSAGRVSGSAGFLSLAGMVVRAHFSLFKNFAVLGRKRKAIQKSALLNDRQFLRLLKDNAIGEREIARL